MKVQLASCLPLCMCCQVHTLKYIHCSELMPTSMFTWHSGQICTCATFWVPECKTKTLSECLAKPYIFQTSICHTNLHPGVARGSETASGFVLGRQEGMRRVSVVWRSTTSNLNRMRRAQGIMLHIFTLLQRENSSFAINLESNTAKNLTSPALWYMLSWIRREIWAPLVGEWCRESLAAAVNETKRE